MLLAAVAAGAALYATYCSSCHGSRGQGSEVAPPLVGTPAAEVHLMLDTGRMPAAVPGVNEIARPPAFSPAQISQIVQYARSFTPQSSASPLPIPRRGNAVAGRVLFIENCAACHGATAGGASVGYGNVAPPLAGASPLQVAEAIRTGPGVMPRFDADVLTDHDIDDIASYIGFVHAHANLPRGPAAGGITLAHVGPVAEGFVAWLFGLGALLLFIRRIGTTD
ncbi:MAG TPA: c-type cytochrome [Candidatus Cybelea sp.]|jgi:ubiquinol-cytochrome c reductase cytochrome c subunit|nr:c-type cytochrome [Candidatus Cybelea sp.]